VTNENINKISYQQNHSLTAFIQKEIDNKDEQISKRISDKAILGNMT
jgi:hypothetical protein